MKNCVVSLHQTIPFVLFFKIVCLKQSMIQSCNSKRCIHAFIAVRLLHLLQTINRMKTASPTSIKLYSSSSSLKIVGLQQSIIQSCNSKLCIHAFIAVRLLLLQTITRMKTASSTSIKLYSSSSSLKLLVYSNQ